MNLAPSARAKKENPPTRSAPAGLIKTNKPRYAVPDPRAHAIAGLVEIRLPPQPSGLGDESPWASNHLRQARVKYWGICIRLLRGYDAMTLHNPDGSLTCICHEHRPVCDCAADPDAPHREPDKPRLDTGIGRLGMTPRDPMPSAGWSRPS